MNHSDTTNLLFQEALAAIQAGDIFLLERLLQQHPQLVAARADEPGEGYFAHPYLLWFVADNPIRHKKLPSNIAAVTGLLLQFVKKYAAVSFQYQVDYTLGLVVTGHTPRDCGVQIALMDILIDAGAATGNAHGALANNNTAAAEHLLQRGATMTLATAVCLNKKTEVNALAATATHTDLAIALVAGAFYGKADMIQLLLQYGANPNAWLVSSSGFHWHATALHQAVSSGSLESVKILVAGGADLTATDRIYHSTALGWAQHILSEAEDEMKKTNYTAIAIYLCGVSNHV